MNAVVCVVGCMCMHVCVHSSLWMYVCMCAPLFVYMYGLYLPLCMHVCTPLCVRVCMCAPLFVCMCKPEADHLRHSLSLNLELMFWPVSARDPPVCSPALRWQEHHHTQSYMVLEI